MEIGALRKSDHGVVVPVADGWWGGRRIADKLPRLFFEYFSGTSFAVEGNGKVIASLVGIVGNPPRESYVRFIGVHPDHRSRGLVAGCTKLSSRRLETEDAGRCGP